MASYKVIINCLDGSRNASLEDAPEYTLDEMLKVVRNICEYCGHDSFRSLEIYRNDEFFKAII